MLIETSAWIAYYRDNVRAIADYVENRLLNKLPVFTTPLIIQEVLQGFPDQKRYMATLINFSSYPNYFLANQTQAAIDAANIYRNCRKKGYTIRKPNDCMIALVALSYDLPILHNDKDFDNIAKIYPLKIVKV